MLTCSLTRHTVWNEVALQLPFFFYGAWAFAVGDPRVQKPVRSRSPRSSQQHSPTGTAQAGWEYTPCTGHRRWFTG